MLKILMTADWWSTLKNMADSILIKAMLQGMADKKQEG
jgi:hypothetical protein